ncbi:cytochrome P450 2J6-like [Patiria miniata]|uniref:Cytochrome P450 n=1 Tax=Patiria miniata TaxID=46514 RepID=A0A913ZTN4_PATMI|nr:cytochrome P450 2J6-like [Patiria miniata]
MDLLDLRTFLLGVLLLLVLRWLLGRPKNLPPGPWGFPLLGSIPAIVWGMFRGSEPHHQFHRYAAKYGPIFCFKILNKTVVVLNDYTLVKEAFQHPQLSDRPKNILTDVLKVDAVVVSNGEPWVEMRRFCLTVLRSFGVGKTSFEEKIGTEAEELMKEMAAFGGKPFNPKSFIGNAVANVICCVIFGKRYEYNDEEFKYLLDLLTQNAQLSGGGGLIGFLPGLRFLPLSPFPALLANFTEIFGFIGKFIDAHRKNFDADDLKDLTDVYLKEIQQNLARDKDGMLPDRKHVKNSKYRHLSERNIVGTIVGLFGAGSETTATTLQWALLYMMVYPDIQKRVQAEIDDVVGRNRMPRMADIPELHFTRAVTWEVQRLANIVPLGVPHSAASDIYLQGYLIPKDTLVLPNMWTIFQDPKHWPEPEQFKPERFLNGGGEAVKANELIPFSTGRRSCIGEHLAKMEIFLFFAFFMHQFTFKKPEDSPPLTLKGRGGLTHAPLPYELCAVPRG